MTQCLGSIGGHVWYLGVAKSSVVDSNEIKDDTGKKIVQSRSGHSYVPPAIEDVQVFKISGSKFLKLNRGTWHAGPLFKAAAMDFYNLELSNTNVSFSHSPFLGHWRVACILVHLQCSIEPGNYSSFGFLLSSLFSRLLCTNFSRS